MILWDIVPVFALLLILSKSWTTNLGGKFQQSFSRSQNTAVALYLLSDTSGCVGVDPSNLWVLEKASSCIPWVPCGGCLRSVGYQYVFTGLSVHAQPHWEHGSNYWKQVRLVPDQYWILPRLPLITDLVHTFADLQICSPDFLRTMSPCWLHWKVTSTLHWGGLQPGAKRMGWELAPPYLRSWFSARRG